MRLLIAIPLALILSGSIYAQEQTQPKTAAHPAFDPARDPVADLKEAVVLAKKSGRRILLDVGGEWCIWCRRLDYLFQTNATLGKFLNDHYVVVKVNVSKENRNEAFLSRYPKVAGYPHLFVLDKNGKFLYSQDSGKLEAGEGHDSTKVMTFLKDWSAPGSAK